MKSKLSLISPVAAVVTMAIGIVVMIGWFTHNDALRSVFPGTVMMRFNTALGFILSSAILLINYWGKDRRAAHYISVFFSVIVLLIGLLTTAEYLFGSDLGIDELFVKDEIRTAALYYSGRMSPLAAINFLLIGIGLIFLNKGKAAAYQLFYVFSIAFISLLILVTFNFITDIPRYIQIAFHTAIAFIILVVSIYFAQPMLREKISFERKLFGGFIAIIILIIVVGVFAFYYSDKRIVTSQLVNHTNLVLNEAEQTLSHVKDIEGIGRAYIITGDPAYINDFAVSKDSTLTKVNSLKELTKDNPVQQLQIDSLIAFINKRIFFSEQFIQLKKDKEEAALNRLMTTKLGKVYSDRIREITWAIQREENNLLAQRQAENIKSIESFNNAFVVFLAGVFALLIILFFAIRQNIRIRKKSEANLGRMNNELEQKVAERTEQLASSELRFRSIIDQYPSPVIRYGPDGTYITANPAWEIMWEDKRENVRGYNIRKDPQMLASGLSGYVEKAFAGEVATSEIYQYDPSLIGKKGRKRWIQMLLYPLKDAEGNILEVILITLDMTDNKEAQEKLVASEKQFRHTLDNMLEGAQIIDFDWRYIYINDSLAKHGKYSKAEMIGYTVMEKYPGIEQTEIFKIYERCFTERVSIHLENEFSFPDKTKGWFELSFQPVPEGIFILSIDITERKKAEAAILHAEANYREIFDKASDAIYVHEIGTGRVLETNQRASEITGYTKEEIITSDPQDFITDDPQYTMQHAFEYLQKAAAGEPQLFEWLGKNKDGRYNWLEVNLKKANIAGQERILAFFREINDRKKVQQEIQKLNEELEQKVIRRTAQLESVNKELEAFSYSISHDLRAPLRGIVGFTEMLEEKYTSKLDSEAKRITAIIKGNILKMGNLIDDLLAFSRMSRQEIIKTNIPTNELVKEIIAEFNNGNQNIDWHIDPLPDAYGDVNAIRQVWINLISNARKYSSTSVSPRIEIGSYDDHGQQVFFIKDNGVGFDPKYKDKLFKVFQRLHSANEFEGTGVGLAIVEKIISKHGGKVWAEAEKDKGASFFFSLPGK